MFDRNRIRNFSIIAHIDHGKSTLADRILMNTGAVAAREMRAQFLDDMELEREMGITIKANRATVKLELDGVEYMLNLLDTPGHVDFHYEVSRALAACEGVLLLVDATQGVQAQTVANAYMAVEAGLEIIPVINKVDLPTARPEDTALELEHVLGLPAEQAIFTSAKTGLGIDQLFRAIVERIPPPPGDTEAPLKALVYDAKPDVHRGVVCHMRVMEGSFRRGDKILLMAAGRSYVVTEVGKYFPKPQPVDVLAAGEVGYMVAGIKTLNDVNIGDTVTLESRRADKPLPGYKPPQRMVFCDFYPGPMTEAADLRAALENLWLNDCSFSFDAVHSQALGFGFRCGFLGLLHMQIIQERIERESGIDIVQTAPTVTYQVQLKGGDILSIDSPSELPDMSKVAEIREPIINANLIVPADAIGPIMQLAEDRRGKYRRTEYLSPTRAMLTYEFPLAEIIYDFYDRLKAATHGYGTMDYELKGYQADDLVKLDILVNGTPVDALSIIVHRDKADRRGRALIRRLRKEISRHMFDIPLQAAIGNKIIARETIKALRKDVTAKCYGGDVTRKRKLLEKQKEGKKRMKMVGQVSIPQEAFMAVLDPGDDE
ncbi:MAG TPA: translation elongation factor 4 [Phycisphaerae bacterium]|nr:translation elongation factor 4 [Phycisphaerae bacterium]HOJ73206.1 translation elongation factor 4 [Phycisphaerae bacterium]HOM51228.1 translation elongation factor 4 [Phycisphaerae bacterium]HON67470.1 translation elongation factor 4 [Phycisphaerae bacterium]HOQ87711.1 translation elongation factor 4 [Phycisphaerae bacterium]